MIWELVGDPDESLLHPNESLSEGKDLEGH